MSPLPMTTTLTDRTPARKLQYLLLPLDSESAVEKNDACNQPVSRTMNLVGYTNSLSVQPGDKLSFMISSAHARYSARIVKLIHGDDRPVGPGFKCEPIHTSIEGEYPGYVQELHPGSYVRIPYRDGLQMNQSFTIQMWIWPTTPDQHKRNLMSQGAEGTGFTLSIDHGLLTFEASGKKVALSTLVLARVWYLVTASYDHVSRLLWLSLQPRSLNGSVTGGDLCETLDVTVDASDDLILGAEVRAGHSGHPAAVNVFNGKIDSPRLFRAASSPQFQLCDDDLVAAWDFSVGIDSWTVKDVSGNEHHGVAVNQPTRGATGHNWDGSETAWRHAPHLYGAIYFHDDDLSDAAWDESLSWNVPTDFPSAVYALHIAPLDGCKDTREDDYIPFFVRPPRGVKSSRIALLIPTFSYMAYANERILNTSASGPRGASPVQKEDRYILDQRLLSLYDKHSDGSGVCYSSRLRPMVNMRPRMVMQYLAKGRGSPHGFNADLCLVDWLSQLGFQFDVITDEDLHHERAELLDGYAVVLTATHNEYWSIEMISAAQSYLSAGGNMLHLSGNGMYWVTQLDRNTRSGIEIRRRGPGTRMWDAAPGEGHLSSTGELGGLWRYRGYAPQSWLGVGFTAETSGPGRPYARLPDSYAPRARFIFEGVAPDESIGDFPNLIQDYGAAGYEFDRADVELGTPGNTLLLATASGFSDDAQAACEEITFSDSMQSGSVNPRVRCDMVLVDYPKGGAVFSVGSIAWCGALSYNNYQNNVSRITENVLRAFASDAQPNESGPNELMSPV